MEIAEDSPYFGPSDKESSEQETDNVFTNPRGQIHVTLKFNAYQVADSNIETIIFNTEHVEFATGEVTSKNLNRTHTAKVDN